MKSIFLIAILATLALAEEAAVEEKGAALYNLSLGGITSADRLLVRNYFSRAPILGATQSQDITYRFNSTNNRISAIRAFEVGLTQFANAYLVAGGIGWNYATVRLQTAVSRGYYYQVEFWGR